MWGNCRGVCSSCHRFETHCLVNLRYLNIREVLEGTYYSRFALLKQTDMQWQLLSGSDSHENQGSHAVTPTSILLCTWDGLQSTVDETWIFAARTLGTIVVQRWRTCPVELPAGWPQLNALTRHHSIGRVKMSLTLSRCSGLVRCTRKCPVECSSNLLQCVVHTSCRRSTAVHFLARNRTSCLLTLRFQSLNEDWCCFYIFGVAWLANYLNCFKRWFKDCITSWRIKLWVLG